MPIPRLPRPTCRRLCLCTFLTTSFVSIVVFVWSTFCLALPMRRAHYLELDYQRQLIHASEAQSQVAAYPQPLVDGVEQLFFWRGCDTKFKTYDASLGLNYDGTATPVGISDDWKWRYGKDREMWIYLAGTAPDSISQPSAYTHKWKTPNCNDPGYICDSHLDAFRRISKRWPESDFWGPNGITARVKLRWVDCDVSPMLCSPFWGLAGSNLLVHMKIGTECDYTMVPGGSCPVQWRWVGLPVYHAPWTRQIRIPLDRGGSTVVPAFPSAEEQMWNIMTYPDALDSLAYDDEPSGMPGWNSIATIKPQRNDAAVSEGGLTPMATWGSFRAYVDNPWEKDELPYEYEMKCYIERYADILLGWWDDAADLVHPRSCVGIAEARRQQRKDDQEAWDEFQEREEKRRKKEWDEMMDETFANIRKWSAQRNGTVDGEGIDEEIGDQMGDEIDYEDQ